MSATDPIKEEADFRRKLSDHPADEASLLGMARLALLRRRPEEALEWIDKALAALPGGRPPWHLLRGRALGELGRREEAQASFEAFIAACPADPQGYLKLAELWRMAGRQDEAAAFLERTPGLLADIRVTALYLHCLAETGRVDEATHRLRKCVPDAATFEGIRLLLPLAARLVGKEPPYRELVAILQTRFDAIVAQRGVGDEELRARLAFCLGDVELFCRTAHALGKAASLPVRETLAGLDANPSERKVFGIGLGKTGTSSFTAALRILGYRAFHWVNPISSAMLDMSDARLYDSIADGWSAEHFDSLARVFPDARFVLTTREPAHWEPSFRRHYQRWHHLTFDELQRLVATESSACIQGEAWRALHRSLYTRHASPGDASIAHEARVAACFRTQPERLLRLDLSEEDPWASLCRFLGKPVPSVPYPHENAWKPDGGDAQRPGNRKSPRDSTR